MGKVKQTIDTKYEKVTKDIIDKQFIVNEEKPLSYGYGVRHLQALILFLSLCTIFIGRAHISATIVAMTDVPGPEALKYADNITFMEITENDSISYNTSHQINTSEDVNSTVNLTNGYDLNENISSDHESRNAANKIIENGTSGVWNVFKVYSWSKSTQEMVLGAFFVGYMIMQTPMGLVVQRWGGKLPLQIGLFSTGVITFFTPWLANWGGYKAVCLTRVAIGLSQSGTYPSIHTLVAKWVPVCERSRLATYVYTGSMIGTVLAYHTSGFLSVSRVGWPLVFWVTGILSLLMGLVVTWLMSPSPQQHQSISDEEKNFILGGVKDQTEKRHPTPWKAIMSSKQVWAAFIAHIGSSTTHLFMFSQTPTYLHHAVGLNIKNSGILSSLPYFSNFVISVFMAIISDYCINKKIMTMKLVRIISTCISNIGPALGMFALSYITNPTLAVSCLMFCMASLAGSHTGWMLNYIDLSPNFSGTLMATGNTLMNISALLLPVLVSHTVTDVTDVYQWRIVLFIVGSIALVCNVVFICFMSADVQSWNDPEYQAAVQKDPDEPEEKRNCQKN